MAKLSKIFVPLLNPNETDSLLASLLVEEKQFVHTGDILAVFETTKSTFDLTSDRSGFVLGLHHQAGETLRAGDLLFYISDFKDAQVPASAVESEAKAVPASTPEGLRIT
ncbi:MAG: biotin/lipoyl-containing protein, partial [Anaerolineaceae bacterium]